MGANYLSYGQLNWDLKFRCLERTSNRPGGILFGALTPVTHTSAAVLAPLGKGFQKGQCFLPVCLLRITYVPIQAYLYQNMPLADAPCDHPALKRLHAQAQCD